MLFSYNWLQSFFEKKLPKPKELAGLLTMHSFEVEDLKEIPNPKLKRKKDWVFDIDILSNRVSDCAGHIGMAREIAAITKLTFTTPAAKLNRENERLKVQDFLKVEVRDKVDCPRYTARVITDVKVKQSPRWMQERLLSCGLRPINNIVDATNYVMLETGQPLHAFDFEKVESIEIPNSKFQIPDKSKIQSTNVKKIIVRKAKRGETITTLDGDKYDLDPDVLVIADSKGPLAIAGIKGGKKAEIDNQTKTIVLEAANFKMKTIRKARQKLKLQTEASWRFEHCLDSNLTEIAINRVAGLIQEIAGSKITKGLVDVYPKKNLAKRIRLDLDYVEKLLGAKIPQKEIFRILENLGFRIIKKIEQPHGLVRGVKKKVELLEVEVPTFRLDVSIPEDLVEEIGRIYGYDKIKPLLPVATLIPPKRQDNIFWQDAVRNILKEACFSEIYNYSFISEKQAEIFGYKSEGKGSILVEIENPMSIEQKYLRPSLIPNLLKDVQENQKQFGEMRIFEIGKTYYEKSKIQNPNCSKSNPKSKCRNSKAMIKEKTMLAGAIAGKETKEEFYELKGVCDLLLNKLGISDVWYDEYQPTPEESKIEIWDIKRCAEIKIGQEEIGFLGAVSQKILENLKIKGDVWIFDIDFEELLKQCSEEHEYQPISFYPCAVRDLAVLVPKKVKVVDVLNKINSAGGILVRDVDLFDIYEGKELPAGFKNLAFHIIYQAEDRTLSKREIDEVHNRIIEALEEEVEWQVRR